MTENTQNYQKGITILTIEDEVALRKSIVDYFEDSGFTVIEATNGNEGLEAFRTHRPDIVFTDLSMPNGHGLDIIPVLRREGPLTPIIVISGAGMLQDAVESMKCGAWDYLSKPIRDLSSLEEKALNLLSRARKLEKRVARRKLLQLHRAERLVAERTAELQKVNESLVEENRRRRMMQDEVLWLNQDLKQQKMALEHANQELEAFSYSVSHDLRAPLTAIGGFSQVLLEDYGDKLDENGRDCAARIVTASQRMGKLIDALLQLARIGRQPLKREPVDLSALARTIEQELRFLQPARSITVNVAEDLVVSGDQQLLRSVMNNLLGNAWKYTSKKKTALIELGVQVQQGEPVFFVRDDGAGFDMAYADKLFSTLQRLHSSHEFEGNGIGLATVHRIIQRHGGKIWAESVPGEGATFYFTLPNS